MPCRAPAGVLSQTSETLTELFIKSLSWPNICIGGDIYCFIAHAKLVMMNYETEHKQWQ